MVASRLVDRARASTPGPIDRRRTRDPSAHWPPARTDRRLRRRLWRALEWLLELVSALARRRGRLAAAATARQSAVAVAEVAFVAVAWPRLRPRWPLAASQPTLEPALEWPPTPSQPRSRTGLSASPPRITLPDSGQVPRRRCDTRRNCPGTAAWCPLPHRRSVHLIRD